MNEHIGLLKTMVRGSYDLQALRMQAGLRLCANFRAKLKEAAEEDPEVSEDGELSEEAERVIDRLKDSYKRLTDGVARNRTLPTEKGFSGDELISEYTELVLVDQYIQLERQEVKQFSQFVHTLEQIPIYTEYLRDVRGIGPALAGVLISCFDIHQAKYISSFWKYAGLDVGPDGAGRSRRAEHLVEREYEDRQGKIQTRMSVTYNPWLKMKLLGAMGPSFLRSNSPWREAFDGYKHRVLSDQSKIKVELADWKKRRTAGEDVSQLWPPGRIKNAALRYMVKAFLADFWLKWRALEGLPVSVSYAEAKLGQKPHKSAA
jgi:hypothetical protein